MAKTTSTKKLSEVDKFYINGNRDKGAVELAKTLGHKVTLVQKYIDDNPQEKKPEGEAPFNPPNFIEMTCPKDADGKSRGISILSHGASELADASKKTGKSRHSDCIQNIKKK